MQFTAVAVAALAFASSASALNPSFDMLSNPLTGEMSGCGNQGGVLNVAALNQNTCGSPSSFGGMSCGNQAGGILNAALLNSNNCARMGGGLYGKSDNSINIDRIA